MSTTAITIDECPGCIAGRLGTDEARDRHDELVEDLTRFQSSNDLLDLAIALDALAEAAKGSGADGRPTPREFDAFVAEHNWPRPAELMVLARSVVGLVKAVVDSERLRAERFGPIAPTSRGGER